MDVKILLGRRIKEFRLSRNMTQAQLAELVNVEPKHISCIERGKNYPSAELLDRIATVFGVEHYKLYQFEHLQDPIDLQKETQNCINNLKYSDLQVIYKITRELLMQ